MLYNRLNIKTDIKYIKTHTYKLLNNKQIYTCYG